MSNDVLNGMYTRIVIAAQTIANIVKTSLGPLGLDKMLVDNIGVRIPLNTKILYLGARL